MHESAIRSTARLATEVFCDERIVFLVDQTNGDARQCLAPFVDDTTSQHTSRQLASQSCRKHQTRESKMEHEVRYRNSRRSRRRSIASTSSCANAMGATNKETVNKTKQRMRPLK